MPSNVFDCVAGARRSFETFWHSLIWWINYFAFSLQLLLGVPSDGDPVFKY